jgi:hypothetical protein
MIRFLTALLVCFALVGIAQKSPIKYGEIPMEDMKMTVYDKDSSAVALVLADFGESSMIYLPEKGFALNFQRITRIKILKKEGMRWGDFEIPLYHNSGNSEKISGLKATTYNLVNGKQVESKIQNDAVFKEKFDDNFDIMKFTLPNVKEGSIVEVSYKILSDFIFHFQDWEFQSTIPVRWSEYRARIPEYFSYEKYMQGYVTLDVVEQSAAGASLSVNFKEENNSMVGGRSSTSTEQINFSENHFRWVAKDVPAFKSESFITTYKDYISKINFELSYSKMPNQPIKNYMGSWEDINKNYSEDQEYMVEIRGNGHLKQKTNELIAGLSSPEEKIAAVYQYVRENFQWDGTSRKFLTTSLKRVVDEKKGNSAEINFLLASMLDKADIAVDPILVSTRDHGFVRESLPISSQFNHVIFQARVGEKRILLDATQKLLPVGFLPERCLNGRGFVISKNGYSWVNLVAPSKSRTSITADLTLADGGEFSGKLTVDRTGYPAQNDRGKYFSKGEAEYVNDFKGTRNWEISKSAFENIKDLNASFKETHDLEISEHATVAGEMIYFNPLFIKSIDENKFKSATREYPVDFGSPFDLIHFIKINIPSGFVVEEIPTNKAFALSGNSARFIYSVVQKESTITITSNLQINRGLFAQIEYEALREFYAQVVAKHAEQIVLKKK